MVPKGWSLVEAQDICTSISVGVVIKPSQYYVSAESGVKAFRSANVREGFINDTDWVYFSEEGHKANKKSHLKTGDVLIVRSGLPGVACVVTPAFEGFNAIDIVIARPNQDKVIPEYLCAYTNSHIGKSQVLNLQGGMAQKHLNVGAYQTLKIKLPPLLEQKEISRIIGTWDKAITTTEKLLKNSQQQKRALIQELLGSPEKTKNRIPQREFKHIYDIADRIQRKSDGGEHPVLTISSLSGFVRQDEKYSRFMAGKSVENYILLRRGEFAYNKGNSKTYEFGCIFDLDSFDAGLVPHVYVCFKLKPGLSHRYFKYLFEADYLKPQLGQLVYTGVRNIGLLNIKPSEFMNTKVPVPSLEEQERIADILHVASKQIIALEQKLACLKQEKKALMQQLLTGKRRITVDAKGAM